MIIVYWTPPTGGIDNLLGRCGLYDWGKPYDSENSNWVYSKVSLWLVERESGRLESAKLTLLWDY